MRRLTIWWFCWWFLSINTVLLAYRLHAPVQRGMLAIVAIWLLWLITRGCAAALRDFCRADMRGARTWQQHLGNQGIFSRREARLRFALTFWLWWGVAACGGLVTVPMTAMSQRVCMSVGFIVALALATHIRGHAAIDLYRASASAAAARRVQAGDSS